MVGLCGPSTSWRVNTTSALGRLEAVLTRHFAQDGRRGRRIGGSWGVTAASVGVNGDGRAGYFRGNDGSGFLGLAIDEDFSMLACAGMTGVGGWVLKGGLWDGLGRGFLPPQERRVGSAGVTEWWRRRRAGGG